MKKDGNIEGNTVMLKFPSKLLDTDYKNIDRVSRMFEDSEFTETKLRGFMNLIGLEDMDYAYVYVLAKILTSETPQSEFCCTDFIIPPIVAARALEDLKDKKYLTSMDDSERNFGDSPNIKWYSISPKVWDTLVTNGTLKGMEIDSNILKSGKTKLKNKYLVYKEDIQGVKLYYNKELDKSIDKVKNVLKDENLKNVQKRILEENQHSGICISFYGPSGTGKTEMVLQLAKEVGRDVYNYKIADSESRFCGDKQNIINGMFNEFNKLCKSYKRNNLPEPILLLNEADALFSRRHDESDENNTANRENNQMQAELLNHIENFDGILIITTNQIQNFDNAVERRFLFKIKFDNPDKDTQKAIWKNRFPSLKETDLKDLVDRYSDFTGGNIQNVKKKSSIEYVISGKKANLKMLLELCKDEKIEKENVRKIGFGA